MTNNLKQKLFFFSLRKKEARTQQENGKNTNWMFSENPTPCQRSVFSLSAHQEIHRTDSCCKVFFSCSKASSPLKNKINRDVLNTSVISHCIVARLTRNYSYFKSYIIKQTNFIFMKHVFFCSTCKTTCKHFNSTWIGLSECNMSMCQTIGNHSGQDDF